MFVKSYYRYISDYITEKNETILNDDVISTIDNQLQTIEKDIAFISKSKPSDGDFLNKLNKLKNLFSIQNELFTKKQKRYLEILKN